MEMHGLREKYKTDGFVVVPGLVTQEVRDEIASQISGIFLRRLDSLGVKSVPRGSQRADITGQLASLFAEGVENYIAAAKLTQHLIAVHRVGVSERMIDVLDRLGIAVPSISTRPVIHYMADALRIEGGYHKTPAHQDWRSVQSSIDALTVWSPIFNVGAADYPLEIIPGSHRRGLLPSEDHAFGHQISPGQVNESEFQAIEIDAGDAVFFSAFLVHRTGATGGELARVALSYRYNNAADPTFIERNYPDRYTYRPAMELLAPGFPRGEHIKSVFS